MSESRPMTEAQLQELRAKMTLHAKNVLLQWLIQRAVIAEGLHAAEVKAQLLAISENRLRTLHEEYLAMVLPQVSPVESDLLASEAQEGFETALASVRSLLASMGSK